MRYFDDQRVVLTLDAGGTNFVFFQLFRPIKRSLYLWCCLQKHKCLNSTLKPLPPVSGR
jgi:hypothetical protein